MADLGYFCFSFDLLIHETLFRLFFDRVVEVGDREIACFTPVFIHVLVGNRARTVILLQCNHWILGGLVSVEVGAGMAHGLGLRLVVQLVLVGCGHALRHEFSLVHKLTNLSSS